MIGQSSNNNIIRCLNSQRFYLHYPKTCQRLSKGKKEVHDREQIDKSQNFKYLQTSTDSDDLS